MIHNPRTCNAFHSACENLRDTDDEESTTLLQLDEIAEGYIHDGLARCTCPPLFKHTGCSYDEFLGTFEGRDLYYCRGENTLNQTVMARRSDEPSDYMSGWDFTGRNIDPWLSEARHREMARR